MNITLGAQSERDLFNIPLIYLYMRYSEMFRCISRIMMFSHVCKINYCNLFINYKFRNEIDVEIIQYVILISNWLMNNFDAKRICLKLYF